MSKILLHTYRLNSIENVPKLLLSVEISSPPLAKKTQAESCSKSESVVFNMSPRDYYRLRRKKISSNRRAENLRIRFRSSSAVGSLAYTQL